MVEAQQQLALFVGLDAYVAAGGSTRADAISATRFYLESQTFLQRLVKGKLDHP